MYDYHENVKNDVKDYIVGEGIRVDAGAGRRYFADLIYNELWDNASITGYSIGSRFCNADKARECLRGNECLLGSALMFFDCFSAPDELGLEKCDCFIRVYVLYNAVWDAVCELWSKIAVNEA